MYYKSMIKKILCHNLALEDNHKKLVKELGIVIIR